VLLLCPLGQNRKNGSGRGCLREAADLSNDPAFGTSPSVEVSDGWPASRDLSSTFIEEILTIPKFADLIKDRTLIIAGARYRDAIDFGDARISASLAMVGSRFESTVSFMQASVTGTLAFDDSYFDSELVGQNLAIGGDLTARRAIFSGTATFAGAEIKGGVDFTRVTFQSGAELRFWQAEVSDVVLVDFAEFGGAVGFSQSVFKSDLSATAVTFSDLSVLPGFRVEVQSIWEVLSSTVGSILRGRVSMAPLYLEAHGQLDGFAINAISTSGAQLLRA
jgi:hypothetical protein